MSHVIARWGVVESTCGCPVGDEVFVDESFVGVKGCLVSFWGGVIATFGACEVSGGAFRDDAVCSVFGFVW